MFKHFIVSLVAVIAFAIFEYAHNRATYSIKTAWVKYLAALLLGTFGFAYLTKWEPFQWVEQAAFVVAFLFFFWVILQKLKIKGVPGQPLKAVVVIVAAVSLYSCSPNYQNNIDGSPFPAQQVRQGPLDALTLDSVKAGWVDTTLIHVENGPSGPVNIYSIADVVVTVKKTGFQDWNDFWGTTWRVVGWFIGLILTVGGLIKFITVTSASKGPGASNDTSPMAWLIPAAIGLILIGTTTYPWSNEMDVPKAVYDTNQSIDKDQHSLDWAHPKTY